MPNWCENKLRVSHFDITELQKFEKAWNDGALLATLFPCPEELLNTTSGYYGPGDKSQNYKKELHEFQMELNKKYFGYADWYDWCVANWGTKWDIGYRSQLDNKAEIKTDENGNPFIELFFESAWSPPIGAYSNLEEQGYIINAYYYESGVGFCGRYDEHGDLCFELSKIDSIPTDIADAFGIQVGEDA